MSSKLSVVLDDEVGDDLTQLVPASEQGRFANEALRARLALLKRERAVSHLAVLREKGPAVPTDEIVRLLRQARDGA